MTGNYDKAIALLDDFYKLDGVARYDSAHYYNLKGDCFRYGNRTDEALRRYDSARHIILRELQSDSGVAFHHMELARAHAGLGSTEEAIESGERSVAMLPVSEDALDGASLLRDLAVIYAIVGETEKALEKLGYLLSIPSEVSIPWIRLSPELAPLKGDANLEMLLRNYEDPRGT